MKIIRWPVLAACAVLAMMTTTPVCVRGAEKPSAGLPDKGKVVPEGKIVGIAIPRANGTWLGLSIKDQCFRLGFYDTHKMPMAPDCVRAVARWHSKTKIYQDIAVLDKAPDGVSLVGNQFVRPPRLFKVFLTLIGDGDAVLESYVVDFHE